jgi:prophage maintenance system killer protein
MSELIIYQNERSQTQISVRLDGETVWLTQRQMADLFDTSTDNISLHLKNIFSDGELGEPATTEDFSVVQTEGRRKVTRTVKHYNLDAIISVGYRVNSKLGVRFRQWATQVLREHLVQGYTFNQTRLAERGLKEARQTLDLLARTLQNQSLVDDTGRAVLDLITSYADTWRMLLEYDEDRLTLPPGVRPSKGVLDYNRASAAISDFKRELMARNEATELFGSQLGEALKGILGSIEQTMFGEELYRSREEKATHLLYFVIKDHPFSDGNKRIGSFLFMLYLQQEGIEHQLNPQALTALALLIAESAPANKGLMIRLIMNLLVGQSS